MKEKESMLLDFAEWIKLSQTALGLNADEIKKRFFNNRLCLQTYIENGQEERMIDIWLDDVTKLSCHFVKSERCDMCFLFPDKLTEANINEYVCLLNNHCDYDFIRRGWILSNCHITIKGPENEYYFMFYQTIF